MTSSLKIGSLIVFLLLARQRDGPISFVWVGQDKCKAVDRLIIVEHSEGPHSMRCEVHAEMRKRVLRGLRANAISLVETESEGAGFSLTRFQPCWV